MIDMEQLEQQIKSLMGEQRYLHSLGVRDEAVNLALHHGADADKAALAGLLHDCAKEFDQQMIQRYCAKYHLDLDRLTDCNHRLFHAPLGAYYAKYELGIEDEDIFDAVFYHTTGKEKMPLLTKIIYLADCTERNRCYPGVEEVRRLSYQDLDGAILEGLNATILRTLRRNEKLHVQTVNARNDMIGKRGLKP